MTGIRTIVFAMALSGLAAMPVFAADQLLTAEEEAMLQPTDNVEGAKMYTSSDWNPENYRKVLIGSVTVYFADDSKSKEIDPDTLKALADEMKSIISASAARYVEVVDKPGPGVALVNLAIVDLKMKNKKRGVLGYTPVGFVVTSAANAAGARLTLAGAKIQAESVDSESGKVLGFTQVDEIQQLDAEKEMTWDDIKMTLQSFANRVIDVRFAPTP
jgi:hypothetical protein